MTDPARPRRRTFVVGLAGATIVSLLPARGSAHEGNETVANAAPSAGAPFRGRSICSVALTTAAGLPTDLRTLTQGYASAVQLMFTGCGSTCLAQGALFADVQTRFVSLRNNPRLLSISIDPLRDDTRNLSEWLRKFGAQPIVWTAAVAAVEANDWLLAQFRIRGAAPDQIEHLNRVFIFNRAGKLTWATGVNPSPRDVFDSTIRYG